ncbi:MAG: hypothetical protein WCA94_09765 [Candidatus Acidiferrum sp.]
MAKGQAVGYEQMSFLGRILVALGLAALVADFAFLSHALTHLLESAKSGLLGFVPAIGMSLLNAARVIAFHQINYFYLVSRILVLFFAMIALIGGLALLRSPSAGSTGATDLNTSAFHEREADNG